MDLRWGLLLVGLAVLVLVYRYSRSKPVGDRERAHRAYRKDPRIGGNAAGSSESAEAAADPLFDAPAPDDAAQESDAEESSAEAAGGVSPEPEVSKIVAIRLMSRRNGGFAADKLVLALREQGLRHGQFGIFHRPVGEDAGTANFSVANLIEPGSFDLTKLKTASYPGVSIFMMLPGPQDGIGAFDDMLQVSRALAEKLDGELLDEQGTKLSIQRERYLREEVVHFQHQLK